MWCPVLAFAICCVVPGEHVPAIAELPEPPPLDVILKDWEMQSRRGKVVQIEFNNYTYDNVFQTEQRFQGSWILAEGFFRIDTHSTEPPRGQKSQKVGYKLVRGRSETWIKNSKLRRLFQVNHENKLIDALEISDKKPLQPDTEAAAPNKSFFEGLFHQIFVKMFLEVHAIHLFQHSADELKLDFEIETKVHNRGTSLVKLVPRRKAEKDCYKSIQVLWNYEKHRVDALKYTDHDGRWERVYVITDYQIDPPLDLEAVMNPTYPDYYVKEHRAPSRP